MSKKSAGNGREELPVAGDLLAIEAVDRTGLIVTSEGAFVRIIRVIPPNPLLMSGEERAKTAAAFQRLVSRLKAEQALQFWIDARPVNLSELLNDCRREVQASAGPMPTTEQPARDAIALAQWRLYAGLEESLRLHADEQAAMQVSAYVVVPFTPRQGTARAAMRWVRGGRLPSAPWSAPCKPIAGRCVSTWPTRRAPQRAGSRGNADRLLDGDAVLGCCGRNSIPPKPTRPPLPALDGRGAGRARRPDDRDVARDAAMRLKEKIAQSSLDFRRSHHHVTSIAMSSRRSSSTPPPGGPRWGGCTGRC